MINDYDKFAKERQEDLKKGIKKPHRFVEKPMMKELLPDLTGKKILMLGCGTGEESIMLKECGAKNIIGIDLSEESIRLAKESYPDCKFIVGDMHNLPFDNESFDFVYSSLAVHYSRTPEEVYKEIYRVLKPNGELLFSVGHPLRWACDEFEVDGVKCRGIAHGIDGSSDKVLGNYNTFKRHEHYYSNGEVLSFYVGSPSFIFKLLKKVGFTVEDFTESICIDECKDYDMCYWTKYHELPNFMAFLACKCYISYIDILNNPKVKDIYNKIDKVNNEPFSHGMKHIVNVCNIMNDLCNTLNIDNDMKEALLLAASLHDVGQIEGSEGHGARAVSFIKENFSKELENNKYYSDILNAIELHSNDSKETDSLFTVLLQAADKFDFTRDRLEDNYKDKYDYFFTEEIIKLEFIYDDESFGINVITTDTPDFEKLFLELKYFHRIINIINVLSSKLNKKPIIKHNNWKLIWRGK